MFIPTIWIVLTAILTTSAILSAYWCGRMTNHNEGLEQQVGNLRETVNDLFTQLRTDAEELDTFSCTRKCARRRTGDELINERLLDIAMHELWSQVDKEPACSCYDPEAFKEVIESNREAATIDESPAALERMLKENAEAVESVRERDVEYDILNQIYSEIRVGAKATIPFSAGNYLDFFLSNGFSKEEIPEIRHMISVESGISYCVHPKYPPVKIKDGMASFIELPPDFWDKVDIDGRDIKVTGNPRHKSTKQALRESIGHNEADTE